MAIIQEYVIPILIVIVLLVLIVLLIKLIKTIGSINSAIEKTKKTVDLTNESLEKLQAPLETTKHISTTIDNVHSSSVGIIKKLFETMSGNIETIIETAANKFGIEKKDNKVKEPSPEDIIKGE